MPKLTLGELRIFRTENRMRPALFAGFLIACCPVVGLAQSGPYLAVVSDTEVKLRAGPSDRLPETGTLKKGDTVIVHDEENGWVAVQDVPGRLSSVSWVQTQFVDFNPQKTTPQDVVVRNNHTCKVRLGLLSR